MPREKMHSSEIRVFEDLFLGPREKGARPLHSEFGPVLCEGTTANFAGSTSEQITIRHLALNFKIQVDEHLALYSDQVKLFLM